MERTLILLKPDALQRNLIGQIIERFERKGLKIIGMKMIHVSDDKVKEHYSHHVEKPFFADLKNFIQSYPIVAIALEGLEAINTVRVITGTTLGREADAGTIRGDFSMSQSNNLVHASDSAENAQKEIERFFDQDELFEYKKLDFEAVYSSEELEK
ncbi:nucleoside-diphosphate kinase [Patescibacteria group bacterium]|nr:nucleoside-diphosphate kinase [Patescibacteria group bacterium]